MVEGPGTSMGLGVSPARAELCAAGEGVGGLGDDHMDLTCLDSCGVAQGAGSATEWVPCESPRAGAWSEAY